MNFFYSKINNSDECTVSISIPKFSPLIYDDNGSFPLDQQIVHRVWIDFSEGSSHKTDTGSAPVFNKR